MLSSKAKYDEIAAVGNATAYAERCLAKLEDELQVYGEHRPLDAVPRTRSLLQQIGDDLRRRRAEILTTTDGLTAERRRLLTG